MKIRLVDLDVLLETLSKYYPEYWDEVIEKLPTIDAVPVVRCKDCMFYEPFREHDGFCRIDGMLWNESRYCSYGERKDGADNAVDN